MHNFRAASDPATFRLELMSVGQECDAARRAVLVARSGAGASSLDAPMADAEPVAELDYVA